MVLSEAASDLVRHVLKKVADCEGGKVEDVESGYVRLTLASDSLPPGWWCDDCKKRWTFVVNFMEKWKKIPQR